MLQLASLALIYTGAIFQELVLYKNQTSALITILVTLIFACLSMAFRDSDKWNHQYDALIFQILSIIFSPLRPFLGIGILCMVDWKDYLTYVMTSISYILFCSNHILFDNVFLLLLILVSVLLKYMLDHIFSMQKTLIELRDTAVERQMAVEEKNRVLCDNQDNSVYLATLQERNRIAREIHDNVGHMLTRSILQTGAIKTINKDSNLAPLLDGLHDSLNTAMNNIRESVHDLHDESVDLTATIQEIMDTATGFHTYLSIDTDLNIPRDVKYGFIAIVKEAVNNAVKHSNGNQISVIIREHPGFYQLQIEDNGKNSKANEKNGIGLQNISDRVKELGGTVSINTGDGFRIFVSIMKPGGRG